jgi:hypothetical protein
MRGSIILAVTLQARARCQCRFEYHSPDFVGELEDVWTALWLRIEVEDPPA